MRASALLAGGGCLLAAWCGWASAFHTGTWDARITWWISTSTVLGAWVLVRAVHVGATQEHRPGVPATGAVDHGGRHLSPGSTKTPPLLGAVWPWIVLTMVVVVWEALGIATGPHQPHLTISALSQAFRPIHAALLATWMVVGLLWVVVTGRGSRRFAGGEPHQRRLARGTGQSAQAPDRGNGHRRQALGIATLGAVRTGPRLAASRELSGGGSIALGVLLGSSRAVGVGFWLGVVGAACAIDAIARFGPGTYCTFTGLLRMLWVQPVVRTVVVIAWLGAGWHLFSH